MKKNQYSRVHLHFLIDNCIKFFIPSNLIEFKKNLNIRITS